VKNLRANTTQASTMASTDSDSSADWCRLEVSFLSYLLAVLVPIIFYLGIVSPQLGFVGLLLGVGIIVEVIWAITGRHTDRSEPAA
jgi:VIT1/CCC1 family predicted Fe2+/Mn2+ transporter